MNGFCAGALPCAIAAGDAVKVGVVRITKLPMNRAKRAARTPTVSTRTTKRIEELGACSAATTSAADCRQFLAQSRKITEGGLLVNPRNLSKKLGIRGRRVHFFETISSVLQPASRILTSPSTAAACGTSAKATRS